ncbi:MAG: M48 family metalloprotease [Myxococcota bacterium]
MGARGQAIALSVCLGIACVHARHLKQLNPLSTDISIDEEKRIGADIQRQIRAQAKLVSDPVLLGYLNAIGQRLVKVTEPQPFIYRFNLIEDDSLNAFAVPGGYIYIHTGVLARAGDVSELAGVLAHEIAHVRRRHIAKARKKEGLGQLVQLLALAGAAATGQPGLASLGQGLNIAMKLSHSRQQESDADRNGIEYMIRAGYDPTGMERFFQRIQTAARGPDIPPYLYSHPAIGERIHDAEAQIERLEPPASLKREDRELPVVQARLAALREPAAGGSGLLERATFDPRRADPALARARAEIQAGRLEQAERILAEAARDSPRDPRVALLRADVAEARHDWSAAEVALTRAFELDPGVPLVQYRLGLAHKQLGNRSQAVFYLEQAASNFRPNSAGRRRAELEVDQLSFPLLEQSGISDRRAGPVRERFTLGESVVWWGEVGQRYVTQAPRFRIRWRSPTGRVAREEVLALGTFRHVTARLETRGLEPGHWTVEVDVGDSRIDSRDFQLAPPSPPRPAPHSAPRSARTSRRG